ncbi:MAG: hypothetical protein WDM96_12255 [Lacunisphaera sp.]
MLPTNVDPKHYDVAVEPDIPNLAFKGSVAIQLTVREATDKIVLNIADLVLDRAALAGAPAPVITYDPQGETATFAFAQPLAPGDYVLSLDYHGKIYQQASGLFALDYETPQGTKRALFTQFENADARRFMPCWDEPGRKATFTLTATVPARGTAAVQHAGRRERGTARRQKNACASPSRRKCPPTCFTSAQATSSA